MASVDTPENQRPEEGTSPPGCSLSLHSSSSPWARAQPEGGQMLSAGGLSLDPGSRSRGQDRRKRGRDQLGERGDKK